MVGEYCMTNTFWRAEDAMKARLAEERKDTPVKVVRWFR
jgi:hypothetical protein